LEKVTLNLKERWEERVGKMTDKGNLPENLRCWEKILLGGSNGRDLQEGY